MNVASSPAVLELWLDLWLRYRGLWWWDICTLRSFCAKCFEQTLSRLLDWPWFTDTLAPLTWPPYSPELITMDRSLWGSIKGSVWLRVTTPSMWSCAELWKMSFTMLFHKFSDTFHRGHGGATACMSSIRERMQIRQKCSQEVHRWLQLIMIAQCSVCCDFLLTLYIAVTIVTVRQKWEVDHCQGLMVGVKVICSSMGRCYIVTVDSWRKGGAARCKFVNCIHGFSLGSIWLIHWLF